MKKILIGCLFVSIFANAQFTFKGTINNYPNKRVIIKLNKSLDGIVIGNLTTDANGKFSLPVKENYTGVVEMSLFDAKKNYSFLADNSNIDFQAEITADGDLEVSNPGNLINYKYKDFINYEIKNGDILSQLKLIKNWYNPKDEFYKSLDKEITNISSTKKIDIDNYPFLNYYVEAMKLVKDSEANPTQKSLNSLLNHFKNSGEYFETSGLGKSLIYNYLNISSSLASSSSKTQAEWQEKFDHSIENLLNEVDTETDRGQNILAVTINFLNTYELKDLLTKYMKKAESLTCKITPELSEVIYVNNSIKEGGKVPNIKFTRKLNGKYSSLYDLKNKYKLILVWASWCGHCQHEMPRVKEFYENFKKSGGEIIGLAVDYDENDWKNAIKELPWLNDSDLLYWDSQFVKELNISGTPTLILVDSNNKILKISSKISEISKEIK
ncbi:TlpA family protein disulfide reductase [Apibacter muscae]|uniref:TlpA family protein disulfide reductase n=1 Tax=Apibacter muscae TaxID=2509004 RepID=A0A563DC67_9FLAO|nr:TlpA disulfide reductase family protein [Apibacter muscae]TWP27806.1 TlpA family protein disulfide reductase [Apibacter muscae]TWP29626.1 TlpA family protein disulfide reductase [Apibacter muscae]